MPNAETHATAVASASELPGDADIAAGLNVRQQALFEAVRRDGFLTVENLAVNFDVTPQTIRRDIHLLAERKLVRRYHGGVGLPGGAENEAYDARQSLLTDEKQRIAAALAAQIPDHASLFINIGTTTEAVARALSRHRGLRVITNNLHVAAMMSGYPDAEVIIAGGVVRARDQGVTGEATLDFIRQFRVDFGIIGISAIDPDGTLRDFDYREVRVAEAIIAHSRTVYLAADHSKFGRSALVRLGHLSQVDALFTDCPIPPEMASVLQDAGTRVFVAT
ncbi:Glycerol-3-phosphate regulon repressor [Pandoraea terrae]|uniref:Glycerol-3-phosphate regulon repressor n=1 Tax=Pandoraea terrae TaxID=1537710 RepID=A0A5E4WIA9_9BURK|nr:DeoR family transcriptional regulator [Pandoraea terrae]VVE23863.1 Glycerol-3-phosphate regulon repressor [Pandoraea terrae]